MPALAAPPTPHRPKGGALSPTARHGSFGPRSSPRVAILHLAIVQAGTEGLAHALRVLFAVLHREQRLVSLQGSTVDLLQG